MDLRSISLKSKCYTNQPTIHGLFLLHLAFYSLVENNTVCAVLDSRTLGNNWLPVSCDSMHSSVCKKKLGRYITCTHVFVFTNTTKIYMCKINKCCVNMKLKDMCIVRIFVCHLKPYIIELLEMYMYTFFDAATFSIFFQYVAF